MVGSARGHRCRAHKADGTPCRSTPLHDRDLCFWHDPEHAAEAAEARRLGGLRRRREKTLEGAFDFAGLGTVDAIRRLLEIAALDTLGLDNSLGRANTIARLAQVAAKLLEVGDLEVRLAVLEAAVKARRANQPSPFDIDLDDDETDEPDALAG